MPSFFTSKRKKNLLMPIFLLLLISSNNSLLTNENHNIIDKSIQEHLNIQDKYNFFRKLTYSCAATSYSKSDIKEECDYGPSSFDRLLKYNTFSNYISSHSYHSNGLNYVTSKLVDDESHHFGNFMNDGVGMIILFIIAGLMFLGWIPLLCCWRKRCGLFDEYIFQNECCIIFWHILTYVLAAAILTFLIVILCYGE